MRGALAGVGSDPAADPPRVWCLLGHKVGDNNQILALADGLGWPYECKNLRYRRTELLTNLALGPTLLGIVKGDRAALRPPWPDLVLTSGRRNEPVARWIRAAAVTERRVRIVHLGRPWASLDEFDLVVATPQYILPARPNVLFNELPLHRTSARRLDDAAQLWASRFEPLPAPRIAVLVGGDSGPFVLTEAKLRELAQRAARMAHRAGGSLLATTSARSPRNAGDAFRSQGVPAFVWDWQPDAAENPYFGILALGDEFIVTGESMSMLTEACTTGKPVHVFDLGSSAKAPLFSRERWRWKVVSHTLAQHFAPRRLRRDVGAIQRHLVATGRACWLGERPDSPSSLPERSDLDRTVERVRALLA